MRTPLTCGSIALLLLAGRCDLAARSHVQAAELSAKLVRVAVSTTPPVISSGLVYDSDRRCLVLFGSGDDGRQTWEFLGNTCRKVSTDTAPNVDDMFSMVYDRKNRRVVLFGGHKEWPRTLDETWAYEKGQWNRIRSAKHPPSRRGRRILAYDPVRERVLLFGGYAHRDTNWVFFNDTWALAASEWKRVAAANPPKNQLVRQGLFSSQNGVIACIGYGVHHVLKQEQWSRLPDNFLPEQQQSDSNYCVPYLYYEGTNYEIFLKKGLWIRNTKEEWKRVQLSAHWTDTGAWGSETIAWDSHAKRLYFFADQRSELITGEMGIEEGLEQVPSDLWVVDLSHLLARGN